MNVRKHNLALLCALPLTTVFPLSSQAAEQCPKPATLTFHVESQIHRSVIGFTQGLEWHDGQLYESTGSVGDHSGIDIIAPNGSVTNLLDQKARVFGEGLTILNGEIFQLTWREYKVFVYDMQAKLKRTMQNVREGWGLANDGSDLIFSDGSSSFYFVDPKTFAVKREVEIRTDHKEDIEDLNELEWVEGKLYGNIWKTNTILKLDPVSGCIEAKADLSSLFALMTTADKRAINQSRENVLNGIAYDRSSSLFYLTGKDWPIIFTGRFSEER